MRRTTLVVLLALAAVATSNGSARAQAGTTVVGALTGIVTDSRTGGPITGALVSIEALGKRGFANVDGRYLLADITPGTHEVQVTYIGYATVTRSVTIVAGTNTLDIALTIDPIQLDAIVVTGQQIERQSRELAYSVSTIRGEELVRAREPNFISALAGRTPGVEVLTSSGDIGASTRIVVRGISSLSGDNQPLMIVDGVPISNSNIVGTERYGIGDSDARLNGAIDVGNRGADLNADDIESVTVLRGAAAAALYGQRAKDGVILITTKRGRGIGGQTVTANSSIRVSSALTLPQFQNEYAQGSAGSYVSTTIGGWGPRIAGQRVPNIRGDTVTLQPFADNVKDFYEDGVLTINSFSVSSADDNSDFRLGITYQDQSGIIPSSDQTRTSINLNTGYNLIPTLRARISGSYVSTDGKGRAVSGGNDPNVLTSLINVLPRTFDIHALENYKDEAGNQIPIDNFTNNPYWVVNENAFTQEVERVFGNTELQFVPTNWLVFTGRVGLDTYTEDRRNVNAVGTIGRAEGYFATDVIQERQFNVDVLGEGRTDLTEDVSLRGVLGFNSNTRELTLQNNRAQNLTVPGLYNYSNAEQNTPNNSSSMRRLYGVYGDVTLGFREYLFLNLTGRNDWSSTLPVDNRSFFYPSANLSFVPTDAFNIAGDVLTYAKLRVNFAQVGSDEAPYQLRFRYFPADEVFGQFGTDITFPFDDRTAFEATDIIPPANLKPQTQNSFEIGGELQFFNGRAGVDVTYYDVRTKDQILSIPTPQSTGFAANRTNIGEVSNKGIEAQLNLNPVATSAVIWDMFINFTKNTNRVESLAPGVEELAIQSAFNALEVKAEPGESFGLYGPGFLRDSISGLPIIDERTGLRQAGDVVRLGSIDPDFRLSLSNAINVRELTLSFLVDWRKGGSIFSQTVAELRRNGVAEETGLNRDGSFIDEGVIDNGDGTFRPNDVPVQNMEAFWRRYAASTIHEGNIFDADNARVREVRLDFAVPRTWLESTPFGSVSVGLEGRNIWLFYKKVPHIDPESGLFGSAANGQGIEWNVLPQTRSWGLNLQARF